MSSETLPKNLQATPQNRRGRPAGAKNNAITKDSVKRLKELGFDPIQKLVEQYDFISKELLILMFDEDGNRKERFSTVAYSNLIAAQVKINEVLMRYGYARVPELNLLEERTILPMSVQLTGDQATFKSLNITAGTPVSFDTTRLGKTYDQEEDDEDELPMKGAGE